VEVTARWDEEVSWFHASYPLNPINNLEVGLVPNALSAGTFERAHRPDALLVRMEGYKNKDIQYFWITCRLPRLACPRLPPSPSSRSPGRAQPGVAIRRPRSDPPGMKSLSSFWGWLPARSSPWRKEDNEEQGPAPSGGPNPGLQLTNPFRHAGWQAPTGAPAPAGQGLDRPARSRRQPARRMRPAMHAARRARTGICN